MKELADLESNDCRYPINDGAPYLFCAEPQKDESSYCPEHHHLCNQSPRIPIARFVAKRAAA